MKKIIRLLVILIIFGTVFGAVNFVFSATTSNAEIEALNKEIQQRKDKIKQLETTMEAYKKNIEQKRTEAVSLKNQMGIISNRVAQTETDIEIISEKIKATKLEIEALNLSIDDKQKVIDKQKKIISQIVKNLHINDQKNYVEILLTNDSFADFYNQSKYLENVYSDLGRSVKTYRLAKEDLDNRKAQAENRKKTFEDLKKQLDERQQDLNDQINFKQRLLTDTHSKELQYQTLLSGLRKQYQSIEGEVTAYEDKIRKKLEELDKFKDLPETSDLVLSWPTSGHYITSYFHDSDYPFRNVFEHSAIDIRASQGTPIKATAAGYVGRAKRCTLASCYSYVLILHNDNLSTVYGHLSSINVTEDQFVNRGDVIGYSGGTPGTVGAGPFVTGPHLHFEVRKNGIPVNPLNYLIQ